jgi:hypothetical protein
MDELRYHSGLKSNSRWYRATRAHQISCELNSVQMSRNYPHISEHSS